MPITDTTTSAGLLAYCRFMARRPTSDAETTPDDWYTLLTEGQRALYRLFAQHAPEVLWSAPQLLTTDDGGETYKFPSDAFPYGNFEVRASRTGRLMTVGPEWDAGADFTLEGKILRVPSGKTKTFDDGPYARYVADPGTLDSSTQPKLVPAEARVLIAYQALILWAHRGGQRDPSFYEALFQKEWEGNPRVAGDSGVMGMLKTRAFGQGYGALPGSTTRPWWRDFG